MNLKLVHIPDFENMNFNIPAYQRGYRWTTKQVTALLDDLLEFDLLQKGNKKQNGLTTINSQFYCIQPLVVVKNPTLLYNNAEVFDVIDGQQRLTTIFLIYSFLRKDIYHLRYERAIDATKNTNDYENGILEYCKLSKLSDDEIAKNPDYFYLSKAKEDIENWFKQKKDKYPKITTKIEKILYHDDYEKSEQKFYEIDHDINDGLNDLRFIWYDTSDISYSYKDSLAIFKRLNHGKTTLTAAELIKALLFQCDVYNASKDVRKQIAFRMSTEWDSMEKKLQDNFMWSMLVPYTTNRKSHIDYILSFVAQQLVKDTGLSVNANENDDDYDYVIFNKYIEDLLEKNTGQKSLHFAHIVDSLWTYIQDVFSVFESWFNDITIYHLVGLRLALLNTKNKTFYNDDLKSYQNKYREVIIRLFNKYNESSICDFIESLKKEIGEIISIEKLKGDDDKKIEFEQLSYGYHDDYILNILLTYNVNLYIKNIIDRKYFPFEYYHSIVPSLEHIHPQHLHDEAIDFSQRCQWYKDKRNEVNYLGLSDTKKNELNDIFKELDDVLLLTEEEEELKTENAKKSRKEKEEKYIQNVASYSGSLKVIDSYFDELASIKMEELHCISNMALVDKDTNASLGNGLMNTKKGKLIKRFELYQQSNGEEGAYTFEGTWKVFNKEFQTDSNDKNLITKSTSLSFWTTLDRQNYLSDLKNTYREYVK